MVDFGAPENNPGAIPDAYVRFFEHFEALIEATVANQVRITSLEEDLEASDFRASHDIPTGLLNKAAFYEKLEERIEDTKTNPTRSLAILFFDITGLKGVNDTLGHNIGDALIAQVGVTLQRQFRAKEDPERPRTLDIIAYERRSKPIEGEQGRLGGDEFAIIVSDIDESALSLLKDRLRESYLLSLLSHPQASVLLGARIDIAVGGAMYQPGMIKADLLKAADDDMYVGKASQLRAISPEKRPFLDVIAEALEALGIDPRELPALLEDHRRRKNVT